MKPYIKNKTLQLIIVFVSFSLLASAQKVGVVVEKKTDIALSCPYSCDPTKECNFTLALEKLNDANSIWTGCYSRVSLKHSYSGPPGNCNADLDRYKGKPVNKSGQIQYKLCGGGWCTLSQTNFPSRENGDTRESTYPYTKTGWVIQEADVNGKPTGVTRTTVVREIPIGGTGAYLSDDCASALEIRHYKNSATETETLWYDFVNVKYVKVDIKLRANCFCGKDRKGGISDTIKLKASVTSPLGGKRLAGDTDKAVSEIANFEEGVLHENIYPNPSEGIFNLSVEEGALRGSKKEMMYSRRI